MNKQGVPLFTVNRKMARTPKSPATRSMWLNGVALLAFLVLIVLIILAATKTINLCGISPRSGKKSKKSKKSKQSKKGKQDAEDVQPAEVRETQELLDMTTSDAIKEMDKMKKAVVVIGQSTCPACRNCKQYFKQNGMGKNVVFVDLMEASDDPEIMKHPMIAKLYKMLGNGVPFIAAVDVEKGSVIQSETGFSPERASAIAASAGFRPTK